LNTCTRVTVKTTSLGVLAMKQSQELAGMPDHVEMR
jgi:hypothetical protein